MTMDILKINNSEYFAVAVLDVVPNREEMNSCKFCAFHPDQTKDPKYRSDRGYECPMIVGGKVIMHRTAGELYCLHDQDVIFFENTPEDIARYVAMKLK